jgi:hypothetical protein
MSCSFNGIERRAPFCIEGSIWKKRDRRLKWLLDIFVIVDFFSEVAKEGKKRLDIAITICLTCKHPESRCKEA